MLLLNFQLTVSQVGTDSLAQGSATVPPKGEQAIPSQPSVMLDGSSENGTVVMEKIVNKDQIETVTKSDSGAKKLDIVRIPVMPFPKREIAIMRLANRINALEMNVTLSIR